jgi:hypothetical protein
MAYTVNLTNGDILTSVLDGTVNTDSSITLLGKNKTGYGEIVAENFIKLLENQSHDTEPTNPLKGELWYDSGNSVLKVNNGNGSGFKNLGVVTASTTAPESPIIGEMWFNTETKQTKAYDGAEWYIVGPQHIASDELSGQNINVITDITGTERTIVEMYSNDSIVGIWSAAPMFVPLSAIPGFPTIKPGIQISSSISGAQFNGTSADSLLLDGVDSAGFLSAIVNDSTVGTLGILNDGGLLVGEDGDFAVKVTGSNVHLSNETEAGDLTVSVNKAGVPTACLTLDGTSGKVLVYGDPVDNLGIATKSYVDTATNSVSGTALARDGSNTIAGGINPDSTNTRNFGDSSLRFATIYATTFDGESTSAAYADLAENYLCDVEYEAGTVLKFGGSAEVTISDTYADYKVAGVVSSAPGYLLNSKLRGTVATIALSGRVPCKVIGVVGRGELLVASGREGYAMAWDNENPPPTGTVLGKAITSNDVITDAIIEVAVGVC